MKVSAAISQRLFFSALLLFLTLAIVQALATDAEAPIEENPLRCSGGTGDVGDNRKTWPELLGVPAKKAAEKIRGEMPWLRIVIIPPRTYVTMDYDHCRVRLFVNDAGIVISLPMVG
ncbi:hypothetical protein H6P81_007493 [Aristolochia fimbriata]|uniref:Uncharacterized protein n=1 Tax=Aristolochia fimbriata TaxID=158543 RepID=A0AAV7F124_ARIFI|nr:hypothetical protein H6P81_007493 [Aristolochia fimbriata]